MALSSNNLTNSGSGAGLTTNFQVQYENSLANQATIVANANALLAVIENEFAVTTGWFNTPSGKFGSSNRQVVNLNLAATSTSYPGANNSGYGSAINLDAQNFTGDAATAGRVEMVFMNEWVEILMALSGGKWNAGDSSGEGLSQYSGIVRFQAGHYNYYTSWVDQWLNQQPRQDWVNKTEGTDKNAISFGCALAFIYYLNVQLNFSINQIIAAGASDLATVYRTLTGDTGDPFPFFSSLLEHVYPSSATAATPGPVTDNPFPLAQLTFWANKDTFGKDEVQDVLKSSGGKWLKAFWLVVEGFSKNSFNALGVTIPAPTGTFANLAGISISQNSDIDFENAANPQAPQRIRVPFDVKFTNASLADFPASGSQFYELDAFLTIAGKKVRGSDAVTRFELVSGADPYFTNIDTNSNDPDQNNVAYLSQDLRIFTATPGQNNQPVGGGPLFTADNVAGAFSYLQQLLTWLNNNFTDPSGQDPFKFPFLPAQGDALQADSSVTPYTIDFSHLFNIKVYNNYNFAIARVRMRGTSGPPGEALNTRVFFRLWSTETADTDYQTASNYRSTLDPAGLPASPLLGTDHNTLPFFASGNLSGNSDYGAGGANTRDIEIKSGKNAIWAYYGCFLNLYDTSNVIDGKPVQAWLNGTHHCMVAQIAYDGAPVIPGASPMASDKLAQRNLQVTLSDNPGPAATHRIPQTFDIRPSRALSQIPYPDELMIDWGGIPIGSLASIYWPQVLAADVLALAARFHSSQTLSASDAHTIQCEVTGGVTYVPIPPAAGDNFAGLFTVDLPTTVVTGQEFNILVRRISTREVFGRGIRTNSPPSPKPPNAKDGKAKSSVQAKALAAQVGPPGVPRSWRYVVGTFQVKIPVTTGKLMLFQEENTLAIMKWRLQQMAPSNRWYPVLQRYISYIGARVDGLGGNSGAIQPSLQGVPVKGQGKGESGERRVGYTGKVSALVYDRFGDFEGFTLDTEDGNRRFAAREPEIEQVVNRAWAQRIVTSVYVELDAPHRPEEIVLHSPPRPFVS